MQKSHKTLTNGYILSRRTALGFITILLAITPGCFPAKQIVALPGPPVYATVKLAPTEPSPQVTPQTNLIATFPTDVIADQENDDTLMDALADPTMAMNTTTDAYAQAPEALQEQEDDNSFPQLIGPLNDPLFEISSDSDESEQSETITADDQDDPLFTGELEPLNLEEMDLPGPNDFGTLDGELVDTTIIDDLSAFSDPDTTYDLPVVINEQVKFFIDQYQTSHRKMFERWLSRSGRFLPMIKEELIKAGLPEDLCYLPMIESGFRVNAYSPAKAVGAWQFIQSTGRMYDLTINKEIDERCDPIKSTKAAIRFLSDLYDDFQSWPLALAAYNAGGGRIRTAVQKTGSTDFWELAKSRYLVSETKYYVPKLLAAIIVAKNPERYGFESVDYESPLAFETVQVPKSTHLAAVALAAGIGIDDIHSLNRHLRRAVTPTDQKFCELCVPIGTSELINRNLPLVRTTFTTKFKTHVVKKKDTAARISKKYGISTKTLMKVNRLRVAKLKPGSRLQIPYQIKSYAFIEKPDRRVTASRAYQTEANPGIESTEKASQKTIHHNVRAGESLYQLSRRYNVTVEQIASWNNLRDSSRLSIGQTLIIHLDNRTATSNTAPRRLIAETEGRMQTATETYA